MKTWLVMTALLLMMIMTLSCSSSVGPNEKYTVEDIKGDSLVADEIASGEAVDLTLAGNPDAGVVGPKEINWISPGKVMIAGLFPGGRAEYKVRLHNGKDVGSNYKIRYKPIGLLDKGYTSIVPFSWVTIENSLPYLDAYQTKDVLVYVVMPADYQGPPKEKMQFAIGISDEGRTGNVIVELGCKWLITTR